MALSKENRIAMSKKILDTDQELVANAMNQAAVEARKQKLIAEDNANKDLLALNGPILCLFEVLIESLTTSTLFLSKKVLVVSNPSTSGALISSP